MIFAASDVARLDRKSLQRSRHTRCFLPIAVLHAEFFDANPAPLPPYCTQCDSYKKPFHKGVLNMTKGGGLYDIMT